MFLLNNMNLQNCVSNIKKVEDLNTNLQNCVSNIRKIKDLNNKLQNCVSNIKKVEDLNYFMMKGKKKFILWLFLVGNSFLLQAQLTVSLSSDHLQMCKNTENVYRAIVLNNGIDVSSSCDYEWNFGDGHTEIGTGNNVQVYTHTEAGGYFVSARVDYNGQVLFARNAVEIALDATFSGTTSTAPESVCLGEQFNLIGIVQDATWSYQLPSKYESESPVEFAESPRTYISSIYHQAFAGTATFSAATDFDYIRVNLEHSNMGQTQWKITCPDGKSAILKAYEPSNTAYFGLPILTDDPLEAGEGYSYTFDQTGTETLNSITTEQNISAGSYLPNEVLTALDGCSLNGKWEIEISDNSAGDNGFFFFWELVFKGSQLPAAWTLSNSFDLSSSIWDGDGVGATGSGQALAIPVSAGNKAYTYSARDLLGCLHDTIVQVKIEEAKLTASPDSGYLPLEVAFSCDVLWGESYFWDLGDGEMSSENSFSYTYKEAGNYKVELNVTSLNGCENTDTITIIVVVPPSEMSEIPNTFSPNGDGINDELRFSMKSIAQIEAKIYNRWGKNVCTWQTPSEAEAGWDGRIKSSNREAEAGVYYYQIRATGLDGIQYEKTGLIHLFR